MTTVFYHGTAYPLSLAGQRNLAHVSMSGAPPTPLSLWRVLRLEGYPEAELGPEPAPTPRQPTHGHIDFHGRRYRVTPGAVTTMQQDPGNMLLAYELLRLEGYSAAELDAAAQTELWPGAQPAVQLALFGVLPEG